jgi:rhodanese-related sulfurtransferase
MLAKRDEILMVCESRLRASIAASLSKRAGFEHVKTLEGDLGAWLEMALAKSA